MTFTEYSTSVKGAVQNTSIPSYTNIYYYNGGDSTTRTYSFNLNYVVPTTTTVVGQNIYTGNLINYQYVLDSFNTTVTGILNQLDDCMSNHTLYIGSCHSSCHNSCHGSRGRR